MKKAALFFSFVLLSVFLNAQKDSSVVLKRNNSVFVEAGGNAGFYFLIPSNPISFPLSINYERFFFHRRNTYATVRIGCRIPNRHNAYAAPVMANLFVGNVLGLKSLYLELGAGYEILFFIGAHSSANSLLTSVIGLRFQKPNQSFFWRVSYTPFIGIGRMMKDFRSANSFGVSVGFTF